MVRADGHHVPQSLTSIRQVCLTEQETCTGFIADIWFCQSFLHFSCIYWHFLLFFWSISGSQFSSATTNSPPVDTQGHPPPHAPLLARSPAGFLSRCLRSSSSTHLSVSSEPSLPQLWNSPPPQRRSLGLFPHFKLQLKPQELKWPSLTMKQCKYIQYIYIFTHKLQSNGGVPFEQ